ncbi:hypothetical protein LTR04_003558 [Oleoguttula sp. CCFEE 6159]|nr:hypothetical protein LTR04_003558 [Oleoguttula sp. CCFEE 6159]
MAEMKKLYPADIHPHMYPHLIRKHYNLGDFFYVDFWPVGPQMLVLATPEISQRVINFPKHEIIRPFMKHLTGEHNMVAMEGQEWKTWRSIFNSGFALKNMMALVPVIVEEGNVFCDVLQEHAEKADVFRMEETATRLTIDVIGRVALDIKLDSQRGDNALLDALRSQISWLFDDQQFNPFKRWRPLRPVAQWWYGRKMDAYIDNVLDARFPARAKAPDASKLKHIIDLALDTYLEDEKGVEAGQKGNVDPVFKRYAIDQIRTFVFAGHDTTSSTICYVYHMLSKHPRAHAAVLAEHASVFGTTNPSLLPSIISSRPHLLNNLPYSLAVIKEVLRLFPPASTIRHGGDSVFITDPATGTQWPTFDTMVWVNHFAVHRNQNVWGEDAEEFRPERFLPSATKEIPADSWRPFEKGPRNCIGQELALLETKIIMVMTLARFNVKTVFEDLKVLEGDGSQWDPDEFVGEKRKEVLGEEMWQMLKATAKPRQGMPARVEIRAS